jgi:hypothetical protein
MLGRLSNAELRALIGPNDFSESQLTELATRLAVLAGVALDLQLESQPVQQATHPNSDVEPMHG